MNFSRVLAIMMRQYFLIQGSFSRFIPLFMWVAVDMILWGFMTKFLNQATKSEYDFVPTLLGAVLLWDFLTRVLQGVTISFFEEIWSRNLLNIFATPLSVFEYLAGLVLTSIVTSSIGLAVMLLLSTTVFGLNFASYGLSVFPFILILFLFGIALGIAATAMVLRLGPASEWFVWPIPALVSPFVGIYYPISTLPQWMQFVAKFLPPTYVFESMRAIVKGNSVGSSNLFIGFALSAGYIALACWFFKATYNSVINSGLIARYSAESVS